MKRIGLICKRELEIYFSTLMGWRIMVLFLFWSGNNFYQAVASINHGVGGAPDHLLSIVTAFFTTPFFILATFLLSSLLSMRLFSEEYASGRMEVFLTSSISSGELLLGKFLAVYTLFIFLWSLTLSYFLLFWPSAHQVAATSYGSYCGAYGMLLLFGFVALSVGMMTSAMTSYPLLAIGLSGVFFLIANWCNKVMILLQQKYVGLSEWYQLIIPQVAMKHFSEGLIDSRPIVFYISSGCLFLFGTFFILKIRSYQYQRSYVLEYLLQLFLMVSFLVGVNVISANYYSHTDYSRSHRFSLSEQGSFLFAGLKKPAHIIINASPSSLAPAGELYGDLKGLMDEYQIKGRDHLIVEYVDPLKNLSRARQLQAFYHFSPDQEVVIIDYDDHYRIIPLDQLAEYEIDPQLGKHPVAFQGEPIINAALMELTGVVQKKVYFLTGHGEGIPGANSLQVLTRYLSRQRIASNDLSLSSVGEVPEDASVVVILGARYDISPPELQALQRYWQKSGRFLFLLSPKASTPFLDQLMEEAGITPSSAFYHDWSNARGGDFTQGHKGMVLNDVTGRFLPGSEVTRHFLDLSLFFPGNTETLLLSASKDSPEELQVTSLLEVASGYWNGASVVYPAQGKMSDDLEEEEHLCISAISDSGRFHDDRVSIARARMIVIGNSDFIDDHYVSDMGVDFFSSALNVLLDRVMLTGNTPKMKNYLTLNLTQAEMAKIALWSIGILPLSFLLLGFLTLWRRRQ